MVTVLEQAGRPLPRFSDDDVIDYQVVEAVVAKAATERAKAAEKQEREGWRGEHRAAELPGSGEPRRSIAS